MVTSCSVSVKRCNCKVNHKDVVFTTAACCNLLQLWEQVAYLVSNWLSPACCSEEETSSVRVRVRVRVCVYFRADAKPILKRFSMFFGTSIWIQRANSPNTPFMCLLQKWNKVNILTQKLLMNLYSRQSKQLKATKVCWVIFHILLIKQLSTSKPHWELKNLGQILDQVLNGLDSNTVGDDRATSTLVVSSCASSDETTSRQGEPARLGSAGSTLCAVAEEALHVARLLDNYLRSKQ